MHKDLQCKSVSVRVQLYLDDCLVNTLTVPSWDLGSIQRDLKNYSKDSSRPRVHIEFPIQSKYDQ